MAEIGGQMAEIGGEMAEISGMAILRISKCQFCMPETARNYLAQAPTQALGYHKSPLLRVVPGLRVDSGGSESITDNVSTACHVQSRVKSAS